MYFCSLPQGEVLAQKPTTVSISEDGHYIAFLEQRIPDGCADQRIVVIDSSRQRLMLPLPPKDPDTPLFVSDLAIDNNGSLTATLSGRFSGAYSGIRRNTFTYANAAWHAAASSAPHHHTSPRNIAVGAVVSPSRLYLNADFDDALPSVRRYVELEKHYKYDEPIVFESDGSRLTRLGAGQVTSACPNIAVGYLDAFEHVPGLPIRVIEIVNRQVIEFGSGIAFATDCDHGIGGDDRKAYDAVGRPTVWRNRHAASLSSRPGSIFAMNKHLAVGTLFTDTSANEAFIVEMKHPAKPLVLRSIRIAGTQTMVFAGIGASPNGSVFALAGKDLDHAFIAVLSVKYKN